MDRRHFLSLLGAVGAAPLVGPFVPGYTRLADSKMVDCRRRIVRALGCANDTPWMGAGRGTLRLDGAKMVHVDQDGRFSTDDDFDWRSYDRGLCRSDWLLTFTYNPRGFDLIVLVNAPKDCSALGYCYVPEWRTLVQQPLSDMSLLLAHEICEFRIGR